MENNPESGWVSDRLASVEPKWIPNPVRARALLEDRLKPQRYSKAWIATVTTAALVVAVIAIPQGRALAQDIWYRFLLDRFDVVRVDLSRLPLDTSIRTDGLEEDVPDIDRAAQKVGFRPHLPTLVLLPGMPRITVTGPISVKQTIRIRDLETALARIGATDVQVPPEWEAVTLRTEIGPRVAMDYPGEIQILQARPMELIVPPGFSLKRLCEAAFRSIGVGWREARVLSENFAAHPAWLLDIPTDKAVNLQEIVLPTGPALLIEDLDDRGSVQRATVIYSTPDRMYSVSSRTKELSVRIANSVP